MLDFLSESAALTAFDPELARLKKQMDEAIQRLQWKQRRKEEPVGGDLRDSLLAPYLLSSAVMQVSPKSFWRLYEAFEAHLEAVVARTVETGLAARHPDGVSPEQMKAAARSVFVEGWLPYLRKRDARRLLQETGLATEYVEVEPPETALRNCGACGAELHILPGAEVVVCEACGHKLEVGRATLSCDGCGAPIAVPLGKREVSCPYCGQRLVVNPGR